MHNPCNCRAEEATTLALSFSERMAVGNITLCLVGFAFLLLTDALLQTNFDIKQGFRSDSTALMSVSARSQIECAAACARDSICSGYNYRRAGRGQCELLCGGGNDQQAPEWTVGYIQENR